MAVHTDNPTDCVEEVIRRFDTDDHFDPHSRAQLASLVYEALLPVVDHVEQLDTLPDGTVIHPLHATTATSAEKRFGHWRVARCRQSRATPPARALRACAPTALARVDPAAPCAPTPSRRGDSAARTIHITRREYDCYT